MSNKIEVDHFPPNTKWGSFAFFIVFGILLLGGGIWLGAVMCALGALICASSEARLTFRPLDRQLELSRFVLFIGRREKLWASDVDHIHFDLILTSTRSGSSMSFQARLNFVDKKRSPFLLLNSDSLQKATSQIKELVDVFPMEVRFSKSLTDFKESLQSLDALPPKQF